MKIIVDSQLMLYLMTLALHTHKEFSGFGFCWCDPNNDIFVYDFVLLDIGSETFTQIPTRKIMELSQRPDAENMKVWLHRHPINSWSGTDERTINVTPLGGIPELVGWSVSLVLTPNGWIGRIDNYINHKRKDLEVFPQSLDAFKDYRNILVEKYKASAEAVMEEWSRQIPELQMSFEEYLHDCGMTWEDLIASDTSPAELLAENEGDPDADYRKDEEDFDPEHSDFAEEKELLYDPDAYLPMDDGAEV